MIIVCLLGEIDVLKIFYARPRILGFDVLGSQRVGSLTNPGSLG